MGIQINGQTDTITAIDGELNVSGADLGSASAGSLNVTGIVTASGFSGALSGNVTGNVSGNVTGNVSGNVTGNVSGNISAAGVSTFTNGPVFIGTGTSTGTASQPLQVTGGAYVSGNFGIGVINPEGKITINGGNNQRLIIQNSGITNNQDYGSIVWKNPSSSILANISLLGNSNSTSDGTCRLSFGTRSNNGQTSLVEQLTLDNSGRLLKPYTPHIFGSVTNTSTVSNSYANSFTVVSSTELTFVTDRITVPVAGVYLITFSSISNNSTGRFDANIFINGINRLNMLNEDNGTGFHYKNGSLTMKLAANDYIQFFNQNWYNNTGTSFEAWRTASVTFLG